MSAWIVSKHHIDVLVAGVLENGGFRHRGQHVKVLAPDEVYEGSKAQWVMDANELGEMLWRENHKSINYRYGQRERTPDYLYRTPKAYQVQDLSWSPVRTIVDPAILAKQVSCYDYQSCEHEGYYKSRAYSVMLSLAEHMLGKVEGYEDAPWGVE